MHSMFALGDELTHVLGVNHGDQYAPIWERTQGCAPGHFGTLQSFCVECCGTPCDCPRPVPARPFVGATLLVAQGRQGCRRSQGALRDTHVGKHPAHGWRRRCNERGLL
ncbi:MAG: hypothetical protein KatS3mg077_3192 [Candidatus Binatia bacterium]|nr:MAG: hypothetical protein KatS3mg077_3192 [Candidatus Binatia bacterium]